MGHELVGDLFRERGIETVFAHADIKQRLDKAGFANPRETDEPDDPDLGFHGFFVRRSPNQRSPQASANAPQTRCCARR